MTKEVKIKEKVNTYYDYGEDGEENQGEKSTNKQQNEEEKKQSDVMVILNK